MRKRLFALSRWTSGILFCLIFAAPAWISWGTQWLVCYSVKLYFDHKALVEQGRLFSVMLGRELMPALFVLVAFCFLLDRPKPNCLVWRLYLLMTGALAPVFAAAMVPYDGEEQACLDAGAFVPGYTFPYWQQGGLNGLQLVLLLGPGLALLYWLLSLQGRESVGRRKFPWLPAAVSGLFAGVFAFPAWAYWAWRFSAARQADVQQAEAGFGLERLHRVWPVAQYVAPAVFLLLILCLIWRKTPAGSLICWLYFTLAVGFLPVFAAGWLPYQDSFAHGRIPFSEIMQVYGFWGVGGFAVMLAAGPAACLFSWWREYKQKKGEISYGSV